MNTRVSTLCSLIALIGCVPEIRVVHGDVPDRGSDLGTLPDASSDLPTSADITDAAVDDQIEVGLPDVSVIDAANRDASTPIEETIGGDVSSDQGPVADALGSADAVATDRSCGVCVAANASSICVDGACRIGLCTAGSGDCNGRYEDGCEVVLNSAENCASCGNACGPSGLCVVGRCVSQRSCPLAGERGCGLVGVTGGTFQMGALGASTGLPLDGRVSVSSLLIDSHEVTVARFRRFWVAGHPMPTTPVHYPGGVDLPVGMVREPVSPRTKSVCNWIPAAGTREAHPINCVDWATAQSFCVWDGGRLPTEAEFEYVSRIRPVAGYPSPRRYPWGDENPIERSSASPGFPPCELAQFQSCVGDTGALTRLVGSFPDNGGVFDLAGNVSEWAADSPDTYGFAPCWGPTPVDLHDPLCTVVSGTRSVRGGGFQAGGAEPLLGASRDARAITPAEDGNGLRCVRSP